MRLFLATLTALSVCAACGGSDVSCPNDLPASCPSPMPSFSSTVNPIIQNHCVVCHGPGGQEASKPFTSYSLIYDARGTILTQVYACRMPPAGQAQLTTDDRKQLLGWLVCNAPNN